MHKRIDTYQISQTAKQKIEIGAQLNPTDERTNEEEEEECAEGSLFLTHIQVLKQLAL